MPRNGSGVHSNVAGIPVVSGTTISSTVINNVFDDLSDEITASLPVSGVAPMTGVLRVTAGTVGAPGLVIVGDTNTGIYSPGADQLSIATGGVNAVTVSATQTTTWSAKAVGKTFDVDAITDVASAATCDIGAAATSEVNITGTTTITAFGTSNAGIVRRGTFAGALTLTHNGTSLILPGAANITTTTGDSFVARSLGSGNWRVLSYQRAASAGAILKVATYTDSGSSTTSGSMTNANTSPFSFTPSSANSTIVIIASAQATIGVATGANSAGAIEIRESGVLVGATYGFTASAETGGIQWSGPVTLQVSLSNSSTSARSFSFYHRVTAGSATVTTGSIRWTIMEIAA